MLYLLLEKKLKKIASSVEFLFVFLQSRKILKFKKPKYSSNRVARIQVTRFGALLLKIPKFFTSFNFSINFPSSKKNTNKY